MSPDYFTKRVSEAVFNIKFDSHHINHSNSKKNNIKMLKNWKNLCHIIVKGMSNFNARILNQYKLTFQAVLSSKYDEQEEDDQVLYEIELYTKSNINGNLLETDIDNIDVRSQLAQ